MPWNQESPADLLWQAVIPCGELACPALGCVAAPKPSPEQFLTHRILLDWGCCAAQRGTSPLTTRDDRSPQKVGWD